MIEEIRLGTDLVKLIGESVSLKRSGTNYVGRCPFHEEKSPSLSVSSSKQLYHCFGCHEGGTAITFAMKYFHLPFMDAIERLASRLSIDLTKYQQKQSPQQIESKKKMFDMISYAARKYHSVLETKFGSKASEYLLQNRGLTKQTIKQFEIGFAPDGWDHMFNAIQRDQLSIDIAKQTGLLSKRQKGEGFFDVFRNRIMIPILNPKGHYVGFGGRAFGDDKPKYLNSPQSDIFDKSRLLFGLPQAEIAIREKKFVILVEGYFDQMALFQHGFKNTVATLGTAFTDQHADLLKRYTDKIVVVFDGDLAGLKASRRSMSPLLSNEFESTVVRIPNKKDPDLFVRENGKTEFEKLIEQAPSLSDEMIQTFYHQETDLRKKAEFLEELSMIAQKTKNLYYQEVLLDNFAKKTGVDKSRFMQSNRNDQLKPVIKMLPKAPDTHVEELTLLRLYLESPDLRDAIANDAVVSLFADDDFRVAALDWIEAVDGLHNDSETNASSLIDLWKNDETRSKFTRIFMDTWENKDSYFEKVFQDCVLRLKNKKIPRLTMAVQIASEQGHDNEVKDLLNEIQKLKTVQVAGQGK